MESIASTIQKRPRDEPPQLEALRSYVMVHHETHVQTAVSAMGYSITVPNAQLATILRMELPQIQAACLLDKKLFIRIGYF